MEDYHFHLLWLLLISYILFVFVVKAVVHLWWAPRRVENFFMKQGIKGPKYQLFLGNLKELASLNMLASAQSMPPLSHNILPRVLSFYHHWKKIYGNVLFSFSFLIFLTHTHTEFLFPPTFFLFGASISCLKSTFLVGGLGLISCFFLPPSIIII